MRHGNFTASLQRLWPMRTCQLIFAVIFAAMATTSTASAQGFSPREAIKQITSAEGIKVTLFASEPEIRQPIFVKCDDRGRLWTIQYLQYPNPAGLERVKVDRWSRTVYDRVPEPPPHGPRGADKITILEDTDGDGRAERFKDFVDGLNLVTGVEFGHGGVFVLNVPYLLFYPDQNGDDVPDADPEVLLKGFGMEDAQSMSNHLTWGPDGWLYGVNGSTTTCRIRGIEFQQGLWRYHPITREFELFCEGGSNCYGVTFDANGECYYSTNGGPFVHAVQGGYFYKSFGKHGPLHNLYAYHYFPELERDQAPGGPPTGGTIYLADAFPERFRGTFIAGNFLGHTVSAWKVEPAGSTVRAYFNEVIMDPHDTWSGPTDVCVSPDGSLFVSDFYDQRTAHPDPDATWDRTNGRIYRIASKVSKSGIEIIDIAKLTSDELVNLLSHSNHWFADRARIELARRRDASTIERLRQMATQIDHPQLALEGLWAFNLTAGIDDAMAHQLLDHPYQYVRFWMIRLLGDRKDVSTHIANRLVHLAADEPSPVVRGQIAASAKRLPAKQGLPIAHALLSHHPNESDARTPWLTWWAIEAKASSDADLIVQMFAEDSMWANPAGRGNLLRLIRRFAAEGTAANYESCAQLLQSAPTQHQLEAQQHLRQGLAERGVGLQGIGQGALFGNQAAEGDGEPTTDLRHFEPLAGPLRAYIENVWRAEPFDDLRLELALRAGLDNARQSLVTAVFQPNLSPPRRAALLLLLREFGGPEAIPQLLTLWQSNEPDSVKLAAVEVLSTHDREATFDALLVDYPIVSTALRQKVRDVLFARPGAALKFLNLVDVGKIAPDDVPLEQLRGLALHEDDRIDAIVRKHWGNIGPGSAEEKLATMRRYNNDLRPGGGDAVRGKPLFAKHCGTCHQLFGEGNKIGPDLTTANRQDLAALLANIVDPSAVIRREYMNYVVITASGQVHSGLLAEQDAASITILDANNQRIKVPRAEVESLEEAEVSLMPERALDQLSAQEIRDLFAYLQGNAK
jgi:putative membrane-bound dehydrogenase-like protein